MSLAALQASAQPGPISLSQEPALSLAHVVTTDTYTTGGCALLNSVRNENTRKKACVTDYVGCDGEVQIHFGAGNALNVGVTRHCIVTGAVCVGMHVIGT